MVKKVNTIYTSELAKEADYDIKITEVEDRISNITG